MMGVTNPPPQELTESTQGHSIPMGASWGEQLDAAAPLTDDEHEASLLAEHGDVAETYSDSGDEDIVSLGSEEDEDDDVEPFTLPPAAKPTAVDDKRSESPNSRCSVPTRKEGMFQALQKACRGHVGSHSSQPHEEEEGQMQRALWSPS